MRSQLRIYDVVPGRMGEFAEKVEAEIFPVRRAHGFRIEGPWQTERHQYAWILHFEGQGTFEDAVEAYVGDPARQNITFDPMEYLTEVDIRMMDPL